MALYFFNIYNGTQSRDEVGTECANFAEVRAEAVGTMQEMVRTSFLGRKDLSCMTVNVVDGEGKTVMIVSLAASVETVAGSSLAA